MAGKEPKDYLSVLKRQEEELYFTDGWDQKALQAYRDIVDATIKRAAPDKVYTILLNLYAQTQLVGSKLYAALYTACGYEDQKKIALVLKQVGAVIEKGTLQLSGNLKLDPNMPPHGKFLTLWAETVQRANKGQQLTDPRVHQFRMYIDQNNLNFVRKHYKAAGMTDEEALYRYAKDSSSKGLNGLKMIAEKGRLHNKHLKTAEYLPGDENRKRVTPDFHSEFILDSKGNFVSQWNVLEKDDKGKIITDGTYYDQKYPTAQEQREFERQIMNGESYNYGNQNDQEHKNLDSVPPIKLDYPLRKTIGKKWQSPEDRKMYKWWQIDNKRDGYSKKNRK